MKHGTIVGAVFGMAFAAGLTITEYSLAFSLAF